MEHTCTSIVIVVHATYTRSRAVITIIDSTISRRILQPVRRRTCDLTAMAILRLGSLVAAAGALLPVLAGASSGNSTYSQAEMLRVQASLLDGRPSECPPW